MNENDRIPGIPVSSSISKDLVQLSPAESSCAASASSRPMTGSSPFAVRRFFRPASMTLILSQAELENYEFNDDKNNKIYILYYMHIHIYIIHNKI